MPANNTPPPVAVTRAPSTRPTPEPSNFQDREPLWTKAIIGLISALVAWGISRGILGESEKQLADIAIPIVAGALVTWWSRQSVTPVAKAQDAIELSYTARAGIDPKPTL